MVGNRVLVDEGIVGKHKEPGKIVAENSDGMSYKIRLMGGTTENVLEADFMDLSW
jgi:hypothetical protein